MTTTIKARTTYYNGIKMRSRLEASYAQGVMDERVNRAGFGTAWEYEPHVFAGPNGQWLPDFVLREIGPGIDMYIEVKPREWLSEENRGGIDELLLRMSSTWASEPKAIVAIDFVEWPVVYERNFPRIYKNGSMNHWAFYMPGLPILAWPDGDF